jgi:hypothetical protein
MMWGCGGVNSVVVFRHGVQVWWSPVLETRIKARGWNCTLFIILLQLAHLLHTFLGFIHIYNKQLLAVTIHYFIELSA